MRLGDLGEEGLISKIRGRFQSPRLALGIGDDAAILEWPAGRSVVFCSDLLVENTHFIRGMHPPDAVGYKAVAANVSDIGAMGGVPVSFTVSLALPRDLPIRWVDGFYDGIERAAKEFSIALAGGDASSAESIFVDVAMIGEIGAGEAVKRSGAAPGDGIYVTGVLGGSARGLELLRGGARGPDPAITRHLFPAPRPRVGRAMVGRATAMIDVSDGLSTDLGRLAVESGVSILLRPHRIPRFDGATEEHVLHGGEEYELLIAGRNLPTEVEGVPLTRIGEVSARAASPQVILATDESGHGKPLVPHGWQHF